MHFIAKALFVSTLIITVKAQIGESGLEVLMNHTIAECQVIEKATDGDIETLFYDNDDWPETRAGECFVECFLEGIGIVSLKVVFESSSKSFIPNNSSRTTSFINVVCLHSG